MTIEISAKKVEEAIKKGLEQLGATLDEVDVEVLDAGGFLKKAKVRLTLEREEPVEAKKEEPPREQKPEERKTADKKPETKKPVESKMPEPQQKPIKPQNKEKTQTSAEKPAAENVKSDKAESGENKHKRDEQAAATALEFVKTVIAKMGFDGASVTPDEKGEILNVSAEGGDDSLIIGRHGETLSALSYLAETVVRAEKKHINVTVDCNGYRDRRAASLTAMAKRRANECAAKHRKIRLEPMERIDRRTVHNALTDDARVTTASEGKEPKRSVVIIPKN